MIKYAVGKSGADFKREMSRNSVAVCQGKSGWPWPFTSACFSIIDGLTQVVY